MAASTAATVHEVAQALLDAAVEILATTVGGPVALAYLNPGLPSIDFRCDQAAVWLAALGDEQAGQLSPVPQVGQRRRLGWTNLVTLNLQTLRCITVGKTTSAGYQPPKQAALTADGEKLMEDGWALWNGISTAHIEDDLFGGLCNDVFFGPMVPLAPQGGMAGWTLTISFRLVGYR